MPLQATSGAASYDGFGGGVAAVPNYIEDVFSTYLYTGNGTSLSINNGIDLSTKGGMVWNQSRSNSYGGYISDTVRGTGKWIQPFNSNVQATDATAITAFNTNGFTMGSQVGINGGTGQTYASWTFRKQPKFFDVVTWTQPVGYVNVSHSLGSVPGCIIVKNTTNAEDWYVYHQSLGVNNNLNLNTTGAGLGYGVLPSVTSTYFNSGMSAGNTYVAYLFAHNAGGFGLTGTDNVISCGSFTTDASFQATVTLGYEPQWIMAKRVDSTGDWNIIDNMRGFAAVGANSKELKANTSAAEGTNYTHPTSTGFIVSDGFGASATCIYIAIRRGPMKVPTDGTKVFAPVAQAGGGTVTTGFPTDFVLVAGRNAVTGFADQDRLRGFARELYPYSTNSEANNGTSGLNLNVSNISYTDNEFFSGYNFVYENFRRAPSFFDEVCWTSDGTYTAQNHNLGVVPELVIQKIRNGVDGWYAYNGTQYGYLNTTAAFANFSRTLTSTTFQPITSSSGNTYVQYLFASCPGVSKVGSYTGNGSIQTINCGFTSGARFVLIKRTDSTGDWYVYDTARGMTTLTDPYLRLNSTAAESATLGSVTTVTTGFAVNASILATINISAASYIFLAIS